MTTAPTDNLHERVAHIEATLKHLATKEDIANLRAEIAELRGSMKVMFLALAVLNTTVSLVLRFWPG